MKSMGNIIERYIYDVIRRLPEKDREDVENELRGNILEMIENPNDDEEVKKVLYSLGSPRLLANNYRNYSPLISSTWMGDYLYTLKIVLIVLGSIGLFFGFIESIQNIEASQIVLKVFEVFFKTIGNTFSSMLSGFAIVTIIFIFLEKQSEKKDVWNVDKLPEIPKKVNLSISYKSSIAGLIFTVIFGGLWIYLLYFSNMYLGWFNSDGDWVVDQVVFNLSYTRTFAILFFFTLLADVVVYIFKINYGQWNKLLIFMYSISKIFGLIVLALFLTGDLISSDFISRISTELSFSYSEVDNFINSFKYAILGLAALGNVVDIITIYFKQFKYL